MKPHRIQHPIHPCPTPRPTDSRGSPWLSGPSLLPVGEQNTDLKVLPLFPR